MFAASLIASPESCAASVCTSGGGHPLPDVVGKDMRSDTSRAAKALRPKHVFARLAVAGLACSAACSPDLRPAWICAPDRTVGLPDAPPGLVSAQTQKLLEAYIELGGQWNAQLNCPTGAPNSGALTVGIQPDSVAEMRVIVGADTSEEGVDCHHEGTVLSGGRISVLGATIGGLSGQMANITATFGEGGTASFSFDASYDSALAEINGVIVIMPDHSLRSVIVFAGTPQLNGDGTMTQRGYNCELDFLSRI